MKKSIILSGAIIAAMLLCGCNGYDEFYTRSFVLSYADMQKIEIETSSNYHDNNRLIIRFTGPKTWWEYNDSGEKLAFYHALCEKHNDVTYNRHIRILHNQYGVVSSLDFTLLEIWSSAAWDADHPAEMSLNDIIRFESSTPWPYIQSGYTQKYDEGDYGEYYPVSKLVSELTPDDMTLLPAGGFYLYFLAPPSLDRRHTLFVRLTADDGTEFET